MNTSINITEHREQYRNKRRGRLWQRQVRSLMAAILLMCLLSAALVPMTARAAEAESSPEVTVEIEDPAVVLDEIPTDENIITPAHDAEQGESEQTETLSAESSNGLPVAEQIEGEPEVAVVLEDEAPAVAVANTVDTTWQNAYAYTLDQAAGIITLTRLQSYRADMTVPAAATIKGVTYQTVINGSVFSNVGNGCGLRHVTFEDGIKSGRDLSYLFSSNYLLESVDFGDFDTSAATCMDSMFECDNALKSLDLSMFDTSHVTSMEGMFRGCVSLESLNVSGFDTSHVENMWVLFLDCVSLKSLDLSSWSTQSVTSMDEMFSVGLEEVSLGSDFAFRTTYSGLLGRWTNGSTTYLAAELEDVYSSSMAGTYTRVSYGDEVPGTEAEQESIDLPDGYVLTEEMTDQDDLWQRNGQISDAADVSNGQLVKTAEWTNRSEGTGEIQLHYAVPEQEGTRAVYAFGTCLAHGFGMDIATTQILELLDQYDYVDIVTSRSNYHMTYSYSARSYTVRMETCTFSAADGKAANYSKAISLLMPDYSNNKNYNILFMGNHQTATFIPEYLETYLETNTPNAIYVAFDGSRAFSNDSWYYSKEIAAIQLYDSYYLGDGGLETKTYDDLLVDADMLETLAAYQREGRYYVCINKQEDEYTKAFIYSDDYDERTRHAASLFCYASFALMNPDYFVNHNEELRAYVDGNTVRYYSEFPQAGQPIINYGMSFESQDVELVSTPLKVTDIVADGLRIDEDNIEISISMQGSALTEMPDRKVTVDGQNIEVYIAEVSVGEVVNVRIPVAVAGDDTIFRAEDGGFKATNVGAAQAITVSGDAVTVESPRLYSDGAVVPEVPEEPEDPKDPETPEDPSDPGTPEEPKEPEETEEPKETTVTNEEVHNKTVHNKTVYEETVYQTVVRTPEITPTQVAQSAEVTQTSVPAETPAIVMDPGPATGDDASMMLWLGILVTASAGLIGYMGYGTWRMRGR